MTTDVTVDVHLEPDAATRALEADVRAGLGATPKTLPPKWFYDERGSELFDEITRLPEYYPTRTERSILVEHARDFAELTKADTLVELGSGTSEKTRLLLDALRDAGTLERFVPFDVSEQTLRDAAAAVAAEYPGVRVHAVVGDFEHHLGDLPGGGTRRRRVPREHHRQPRARAARPVPHRPRGHARARRRVAPRHRPGEGRRPVARGLRRRRRRDRRVQPQRAVGARPRARRRLRPAGVRPRGRVGRSRGVDRDAAAVAARAQTIHVRALELEVEFAAGEEMRTEISAKFRRARVEQELATAGFRLAEWWTDPAGDFALSLSFVS